MAPRKAAKTKADLTINQIKVGLWAHLLKTGFHGMAAAQKCALMTDTTKVRERYNFQDEKLLRFERRAELVEGKIDKDKPLWEVIEEAAYGKVTIGDDDKLILNAAARKESDG